MAFTWISSNRGSGTPESSAARWLQRFLLLLKSELIQAGYALSSGSEIAVEISAHSLVFKPDRNRDGDVADTLEKIAYRYDPETKVLYLKSGNAAYQTLIESIYDLKFEIAPPQTCIKESVQVIIDVPEQETVLCQLVWWILNDGLVKRLKS